MKLKKLILTFGIAAMLLSAAGSAFAVPAYPKPVKVRQSDGSTITVQTFGDEFYHYTTTTDGYTVIAGDNGDYYYAEIGADGYLKPSALRANDPARRSADEKQAISRIAKNLTSAAALNDAAITRSSADESRANTINRRIEQKAQTGERLTEAKVVLLLVEFQDVKFTKGDKAMIDDLLNKENYKNAAIGADGSVRDYYYENSNGVFTPEFVVAGPYTMKNPVKYYGENTGYGNGDVRPGQMVMEACTQASDNGDINFSDFAKEGEVEHLFIIYAGYGEADSQKANTIWPHEWTLAAQGTANFKLNGVRINTYGCSQEINYVTDNLTGIGVICHEFGHVLGLPDFYGSSYGLRVFSLMDSGSYNSNGTIPPALSATERWLSSWMDFEDIDSSDPKEYTLGTVYENKAYRIKTEVEDEFYVLEVRDPANSKWDKIFIQGASNYGVTGSTNAKGMLIYRYDRSETMVEGMTMKQRWSINTPNALPDHRGLYILNTPTTIANSKLNAIDLFYGVNNRTSFTKNTSPALLSWAGLSLDTEVLDIKWNDDDATVSFKIESETNAGQPEVGSFSQEANQFDATIAWKSSLTGDWNVSLKEGATEVMKLTTAKKRINLAVLKPNTQYTVDISYAEDASNKTTGTFTTSAVSTTDVLSFNKMTYDNISSYSVLFSIKNAQGNVAEIKWFVDGVQVDNTLTDELTAGEHQIEAYVINEDGTEEYITRYINVK